MDISTRQRWESEASFFDDIAHRLHARVAPLPNEVVERYRHPTRSGSNKEFRFQLLGDLRGKRVLDVGCGEGSNAILLAKCGAQVTGVDVSPTSIEVCERRAEVEHLSERTRFVCSPFELTDFAPETFDVIWGDGVLHHIIPALPDILPKLIRCAKPDALFVFSEPLALTRTVKLLRRWLHFHAEVTPGERPLEAPELMLLRSHFPDLQMRWFHLFGRLAPVVLREGGFERASRWRRTLTESIWRLDSALLSVPMLSGFGGMCVLYAHRPGGHPSGDGARPRFSSGTSRSGPSP